MLRDAILLFIGALGGVALLGAVAALLHSTHPTHRGLK